MDCPACTHELTPQTLDTVTLYTCDGGCGGLWFGWRALEAFDSFPGPAETALIIQRDAQRVLRQAMQFKCPHCTGLVMTRRYIQVIDDVLVDECPSCGGIWLNADDLDDVRTQFSSYHGPWPLSLSPEETHRHDEDEPDSAIDPGQAGRNARFVNACRFLCHTGVTKHLQHGI